MKFLRFKGLIPFVAITVVVYVFAVYYLDGFLRQTLVKQGTKLNGALVDIDQLKLSFMKSRLLIRGVRFTNPDDLMSNRLEIGRINADFEFSSLLKKKIIVEDVSVADVTWDTPRKRPGKIPSSWVREWQKEEEEAKDGVAAKALTYIKSQVVQKLPDISLDSLGDKFDPRKIVKLEDIASYQAAKQMPDEIKTFVSDWKAEIDGFVKLQKSTISGYRKEIAALDPRKVKTPVDALNMIQTVQGLESKVKQQRSSVESIIGKAKTGIEEKANRVRDLRKNVDSDIANIKQKIGFGNLKLDELSNSIFGVDVERYYAMWMKYYSRINTIVGKLKTEEEPKRERAKGRDVRFPVTDRRPKFLLARALLSSDTRQSQTVSAGFRGKYQLEINHLTTNQKLVGKPTTFGLSAEVDKGAFRQANLGFELNRLEEVPRDRFEANLKGYRFNDVTLGKGSVFPIPLQKGGADFNLLWNVRGDALDAKLSSQFSNLAYAFTKKQGEHPLLEIVREVVGTLNRFNVNLTMQGTLDQPKFAIRSTFDQAVRQGVEKVLLKRVREAQAKLEAYLRKEITGKIGEAEALLGSKRKELEGRLNQQLQEVVGIEKLTKTRIEELKKRQKAMLQEKIDKEKRKQEEKLKKQLKDKIKLPKLPKGLGF